MINDDVPTQLVENGFEKTEERNDRKQFYEIYSNEIVALHNYNQLSDYLQENARCPYYDTSRETMYHAFVEHQYGSEKWHEIKNMTA